MNYDVIVIGGGHAGCEAAAAAARCNANTVLITTKMEDIGEMSCNPSIGGVGKGTIVREIDALDGVMPKIIDQASIHSKMLNASKGPAVWGLRAQADRKLYKQHMYNFMSNIENLTLLFAHVDELLFDDHIFKGIKLSDQKIITGGAIVITTGTFLNGIIHIGNETFSAGRYGDKSAVNLGESIKKLNLRTGRLKTGTPPRIKKESIDFTKLVPQPGDKVPVAFSEQNTAINTPQIDCYITHTTEKTWDIINNNLNLSAMYAGLISGRGPRYCPSIEDKIVKFKDKKIHQVFLEPEGLNDDIIYPNGISNSLPENIQYEFVRSITGLENAQFTRPGYAIEYDYVDPRELTDSLELRKYKNIFLAGQINGTTGYEEAAGQGIIAGINAAFKTQEKEKFILTRNEAYIGVMIDDLITHGVAEPYRMFTSRAEYRLTLRHDNADIRITEKAILRGIVTEYRKAVYYNKLQNINKLKNLLEEFIISPSKLKTLNINIKQDGIKRNVIELISFPKIDLDMFEEILPEIKEYSKNIKDYVSIEAKYMPYLDKQQKDISIYTKKYEKFSFNDIDFDKIPSLSHEIREKLQIYNPNNYNMLVNIPGITPVAVVNILQYIEKHRTSIV